MADLSSELEELRPLYVTEPRGPRVQPAPPIKPLPLSQAGLPVLTQEALDKLERSITGGATVNAPPSGLFATPGLSFQERHQRRTLTGEIVPLDITSGLPSLWEYARVAEQASPEAKAAALQHIYPERKVRILPTGDVTLEVPDGDTGAVKDVVINPRGIDAYDLIDLAVSAPEIAAATATAILTQGRGTMRTLAQIILSSLTGAGVGAARDVIARGAEGIDIKPAEIVRRRSVEAVVDSLFQAGLGAGAKALGLASPFARTQGPLEFQRDRALDLLKREVPDIGFELERSMTPAQKTGSGILQKVEAYETPQPGASTVMDKIRKRQLDLIDDLQRRALGVVPTAESVGEDIISSVQRNVTGPVEELVQQAREALLAKGQTELVKQLDAITGVKATRRVTQFEAGKEVREALEKRFAAEKKIVDDAYDEVKKLAGGTGDVLPGDAAANAAAKIRAELPRVVKEVEETTESVVGFPPRRVVTITGKKEQKSTLASGIPEGLNKALADLESLRGGKVSLSTFDKMKRAAYDEIAKTEAVPGVKERWFNQIASAYESGLQQAIDEAGDPALKSALTRARDEYKKRIVPFERQGLADIPRTEFEPGFKSEEELIERLTTGGKAEHNWRVLKDALGADSPAIRKVKRAILDTKVAQATDNLTGKVDAGQLEASLSRMMTDQPGLADDIFGKNARALLLNLRTSKIAASGAKLDPDELKFLLTSENVNQQSLRRLVEAERIRTETYLNGLFKEIAEGQPITARIDPTRIVDAVMDLKTPSRDVEQLIRELELHSPGTRQALSTVTFYRLLDKASHELPSAFGRKFSAKAWHDLVGAPGSDELKRVQTLLGTDTVLGNLTREDVGNVLRDFLAPVELPQRAFRAAGGLAAGGRIGNVIRAPVTYAEEWAQRFLLAHVYTRPWARNLISNRVMSPEKTAAIANAVIASEPFLSDLTAIAGPDGARDAIAMLKGSIDIFVQGLTGKPETRGGQAAEQFLRGEESDMDVQAR